MPCSRAARAAIAVLMPLVMPSDRAMLLAVVTTARGYSRGSTLMITARESSASPGVSIASTEKYILSTSAWRKAIETPGLADDSRRSEEHTSELQSQSNLVCRLLLEK